tara:strand:- start:2637 stop:3365 length:729 start_codon:yes stop_codon:yes gene_type:complete
MKGGGIELVKSQPTNLKIDWASYDAAKYACENWHYSGVIPVGKLVKVGAWEDGKYIGAVIFGRGANNNMLKPFGLTADQGCELVRIALTKHKTPVSKIMALAIKFLAKSNKGLKLIVSYADADQNHHGGIYQATNWIYSGLMNAGTMGAFIIKGKKTHPKSVHSKGLKQTINEVRKHLDPNATIFYTKGKHRYLMPLDKETKESVLHLAKVYPKRTKEQASENPSDLGGATPTCTLQTSTST